MCKRDWAHVVAAVGMVASAAVSAGEVAAGSTATMSDKLLTIGTAAHGGTFHETGRALCDAANQDRRAHGLRCVAYTAPGSESNLRAVAQGQFSLGIARADIAAREFREAASGESRGHDLRAILSLYPMPMALVARRQAGLSSLDQIKGRVISVGAQGSGHRDFAMMLLQAMGLKTSDFSAVLEQGTNDAVTSFCKGDVDVIVESQGHPSRIYTRLLTECGGTFLPIPEPIQQRLIARSPGLHAQVIPGGLYAGQTDPVATVGSSALLVASRQLGDEAVRRFLSSVTKRLPTLTESNPPLVGMTPGRLFSEGVTLPLHPGVLSFVQLNPGRGYVTAGNGSKP